MQWLWRLFDAYQLILKVEAKLVRLKQRGILIFLYILLLKLTPTLYNASPVES